MKIGFLGNVNNYPFLIARLLQQLGYDVEFFVDAHRTDLLHRPESHSHGVSFPYPSWVHETERLGNAGVAFAEILLPKTVARLRRCDAVVLNGLAHGIGALLPRRVPAFHLFSGADLDTYADRHAVARAFRNHPRVRGVPSFAIDAAAAAIVARHRAGIRRAAGVASFPRGLMPDGDRILDELLPGERVPRFPHAHVVTDGIELVPAPHNDIPRVFNLTRFVWQEPLPPGLHPLENKRNDIMVRGLALYVQKTGRRLDIRFVEKGAHVEATKALVEQLGLSGMVTWSKEMSFRAVLDEYRAADIVFEQLGEHVFGGGLYALLMGRPVIGNGRPEIMRPIIGEDAPICQARTPEDVARWLEILVPSRTERERIGVASRKYVLDHFDLRAEARFVGDVLERAVARA